MKKKVILSFFLFFALIALSGCGAKPQNNQTQNQQANQLNNANSNEPAQNTQNEQVQNQAAANETINSEEKITGTLEKLIGLNKAMKCTYDNMQGQDRITADLYISGNKYYQEVTFPDNGKFYSIGDTEWVYTWNSRVPGGTKMKLEKKDSENLGEAVTDTTKQNNYTCLPWIVDEAKFIPPANITFEDDTAEIKEMENSLKNKSTDPVNKCSICDSVPDATLKATCIKESKCAE